MIYLILLIGFILRLINLNQSLWLDEAIEILAVKNNSFLELATTYAVGDFHPPLYQFILKIWDGFFGYSEVVSRFPSVLFSLLTVLFVYKIGHLLGGKKVAILAALFLAINPLAIYYSQEARMYSLAMLAVSAAAFFFLKKNRLLYGLCLLVALYTNYLPYLMLPVFLYFSRSNKKLLYSHLLLLALLIPVIPLLIEQLKVGISIAASAPLWGATVGGFDLKALPLTFIKFSLGRISLENNLHYGLIAVPVMVIYGWIIFKAKDKFLWTWLFLPLVLGFLISLKIPVFSYFRFLYVLPAFVLLLAKGSEKNFLQISLICLISLMSLFYFNLNPVFHREDWRSVISYINDDPGLVVIPSLAQAAPLTYYGPQLTVQDKTNLSFNNVSKVYYLPYVQEIFDPEKTIESKLRQENYLLTQEKRFPGLILYQYQR